MKIADHIKLTKEDAALILCDLSLVQCENCPLGGKISTEECLKRQYQLRIKLATFFIDR